jgi:RNA polymerase sigma-70 factor (ECF subfamily)
MPRGNDTLAADMPPAAEEPEMEGREGRARARLAEMIEREPRRLSTRIGRLVHDELVAEDLAQESLLRALRNVATLRGTEYGLVCKWLDTIATHVAYNYARDERRRPLGVSIEAEAGDLTSRLPAAEPEPDAVVGQAEVQEALLGLIRALPPEYRAVFILRDVERRSTAETALALGISDGLVKWRLHHARRQLRDRLARAASADGSASTCRMTLDGHTLVEGRLPPRAAQQGSQAAPD